MSAATSLTRSLSASSDQLLPSPGGAGHVPNYGMRGEEMTSSGITSSTRTTVSILPDTAKENNKERIWVVARCALIACLASLVGGMNAGFSSPTLHELQDPLLTTPAQLFSNTSKLPSLFGVSNFVNCM